MDELEDAGRRYQEARAEFEKTRAQLHPLVLRAVREGVEQKRIADLTGMTRENIRVLARRAGIEATRPGVSGQDRFDRSR